MKNVGVFLLVLASWAAFSAGFEDAVVFKFSMPKGIEAMEIGNTTYIASIEKFSEGECSFDIYRDDFRVEVHNGEAGFVTEPILKNVRALCFYESPAHKRRRVESGYLGGDLVSLYFRQRNYEKNLDEVLISIFEIKELKIKGSE